MQRTARCQSMATTIANEGLQFFLNDVVVPALSNEGWLFHSILAWVPETVVHRKENASRVRPVLLRVVGALALMGGAARLPVAAPDSAFRRAAAPPRLT